MRIYGTTGNFRRLILVLVRNSALEIFYRYKIRFMKNKAFSIIILGVFILCCSENSVEPEPEKPEDTVSGIYYLHGTKIQIKYDFPWPSWGGEEVILSQDTSQLAFTTTIKLLENKPDTVQFFGLEGANAGWSVFPQNCSELHIYCAYATYRGHILELDLSSPDGIYIGKGTLKDGKMTLDTHFEYRHTRLDFKLEGEKVEEE